MAAAPHLLLPAHHEHDALDGLHVEVLLLAGNVVGAHDADLHTGRDGAGENTPEGNEAALVDRRHHLRHVEHERGGRVAVADAGGAGVVHGARVKQLAAVLAGGGRRREVADHHLEKGLVGGEPVLHGALEEGLALELEVVLLHLDVEGAEHLLQLLVLVVHGGGEDLADRVEDEHVERALVGLAGALPLLLGRDEIVLAPEALRHLGLRNAELLRVHARENGEGEGPTVETR
mmetsp:Transcript_33628/g.70531  ORF Transcript_33628/g.70531 Transcript_33628/m.70531 type:complete len:233 (+) Transcript_33628:1792-2490(+)